MSALREPAVWALLVLAALLAGGTGYALGGARPEPPPARAPEPHEEELGLVDEPTPDDRDALRACEERLALADAIARARGPEAAPRIEAAAEDPAVPDATRACLGDPGVRVFVLSEVERVLAERAEAERAERDERRARWREEARRRVREELGVSDEELARMTPAMCAMRDTYRSAWSGARGGDGGVRPSRSALREQTRAQREEIEAMLGEDRAATLREAGGFRMLGAAIDCGDDGPPRGPR